MATDNNIKHFTATDIEKYHKGLLSAKERHALEKAALDDPFLADALEGYAVVGVNAAADLEDLKKKLSVRIENSDAKQIHAGKKFWTPFLKVAAMVVVIAGAGLLIYQFAFNDTKEQVAQVQTTPEKEIKTSDPAPGATTTDAEEKTSTPATVATTGNEQPAAKDNKASITGKKEQPGVTTVNSATGSTGETKKLVVETAPAGAGAPPVVSAPAKTAEKTESLERSGGNITDRGLAKEDVKTKAPAAARKGETDKDGVRDEMASAQPDDSKNSRAITLKKQADDQYYRNQAMNTFRGRVTDASNTGLPFANVTNQQDNVGTYSDANGYFVLTSPDTVLNVQVRSLGYDNNNTQLRNDINSNKVVMQEDRRNLSEVVLSNQKPNSTTRSKDANRKLIEPEPLDGWVKYDSYLANNLTVPDDFKQQKSNDNNSVEVSFEVDKNGEPVNIRVEKTLCASCDKEAIRLVKEGPKWKRNANKKGRTTVTINF